MSWESKRIYDKILGKFGISSIEWSWIGNEDSILPVLELLAPKRVVEIGTARGLSAASLAQFAELVVTFDIKSPNIARAVWRYMNVVDRVVFVQIGSDANKQALCSVMDFDLAFIDADHTASAATIDFAAVKKCGRVLFHDFAPHRERFLGLSEWIARLEPTPWVFGDPEVNQFAYWCNDPLPAPLARWFEKNGSRATAFF